MLESRGTVKPGGAERIPSAMHSVVGHEFSHYSTKSGRSSLREDAESVPRDGESLRGFVEESLRRSMQYWRMQRVFIACWPASRMRPEHRGAVRPLMGARLDRLGANDSHFERRYWDYTFCPPLQDPQVDPLPCSVIPNSDRIDYVSLSDMAGTTCDKQSPFQQFPGAWFDPFRAGEGFIIEALADDRAVVYWFTYTPDGSGDQAWMIGQSHFESGGTESPVAIDSETLYQPIGGVYGNDFDPAMIDNVDWGSLRIEFNDADTGRVFWDSNLESYGSGDYPIVRLARPLLADCSEGGSCTSRVTVQRSRRIPAWGFGLWRVGVFEELAGQGGGHFGVAGPKAPDTHATVCLRV